MHNQLTLESVAKELKEWRTNKAVPQHRIPKDIKGAIKAISKRYTYNQMAKAFNLYGRRLTNIIGANKTKINKIKFIELPAVTPKSNLPIKMQPHISTISCILQHPNGTTMSLELATPQVTSIIKDFLYVTNSPSV